MKVQKSNLSTVFAHLWLPAVLLFSLFQPIAHGATELPAVLASDPAAFSADQFPLGSATPWQPKMRIIEINENLIAFFDGRDVEGDPKWMRTPGTWTTFDAGLGTAMYVLHDQGHAMALDSLYTRAQAQFVREYMRVEHEIKRFDVVISHWHLDHIGGASAFADDRIISSSRTLEVLDEVAQQIRTGTLWGPPAMPDLTLPSITFDQQMALRIGTLQVELTHFPVHSDDHILVHVPELDLALVGDMIEDTVPVVSHPEQTPAHLLQLKKLKQMKIAALYPDHGNPEVIASGGYDNRAIDAAIEYQKNLLLRSHDNDFFSQSMESFIPRALQAEVVSVHEYYRVAHEMSRENMHREWSKRPLPELD